MRIIAVANPRAGCGKTATTHALGMTLAERGWRVPPADLAMASTELGMASRIGREIVGRKILSTVSANFDIALIDCPSTLSLLTVNALTAAQAVLVPAQADVTHVRGLWLFLATLAP